jgi:hypothetical protein
MLYCRTGSTGHREALIMKQIIIVVFTILFTVTAIVWAADQKAPEASPSNKDVIIATGVIITALIGLANLIYLYRHNHRMSYVNSVTVARLKWIGEFREHLAEFAALIYQATVIRSRDPAERQRIFSEIAHHWMFMRLQLAPHKGPDDKNFEEHMESVLQKADAWRDEDGEIIEEQLKMLVEHGQKFFWNEWTKVKNEAISGDPYRRFMYRLNIRIADWLKSPPENDEQAKQLILRHLEGADPLRLQVFKDITNYSLWIAKGLDPDVSEAEEAELAAQLGTISKADRPSQENKRYKDEYGKLTKIAHPFHERCGISARNEYQYEYRPEEPLRNLKKQSYLQKLKFAHGLEEIGQELERKKQQTLPITQQ